MHELIVLFLPSFLFFWNIGQIGPNPTEGTTRPPGPTQGPFPGPTQGPLSTQRPSPG